MANWYDVVQTNRPATADLDKILALALQYAQPQTAPSNLSTLISQMMAGEVPPALRFSQMLGLNSGMGRTNAIAQEAFQQEIMKYVLAEEEEKRKRQETAQAALGQANTAAAAKNLSYQPVVRPESAQSAGNKFLGSLMTGAGSSIGNLAGGAATAAGEGLLKLLLGGASQSQPNTYWNYNNDIGNYYGGEVNNPAPAPVYQAKAPIPTPTYQTAAPQAYPQVGDYGAGYWDYANDIGNYYPNTMEPTYGNYGTESSIMSWL